MDLYEYKYIGSLIEKHSPGNILIFSVGKDSDLWIKLNKLGNTVFLEDVRKWIRFSRNVSPEINIIKVNYRTRRKLEKTIRPRQKVTNGY